MESEVEILAYCGLDCFGCPIRLATQIAEGAGQRQMREDIARQIEQLYGMKCTADDITDCDGCATEGGRLFAACQKCGIRTCARDKGYENCAHCGQYACGQLNEFFSQGGKLLHMDARKRLNAIRETLRRNEP